MIIIPEHVLGLAIIGVHQGFGLCVAIGGDVSSAVEMMTYVLSPREDSGTRDAADHDVDAVKSL